MAAQKVRSGWEDLVLAGGVESMSRVPMGSDGGAWAHGPGDQLRHGVRAAGHQRRPDRHPRGLHPRRRRRLRARSQRARRQGLGRRALRPLGGPGASTATAWPSSTDDEHIRARTPPSSRWPGSTPSFAAIGEMGGFDAVALQKYHWVERIEHVHHAGNSSGIVDGAALVARSAASRSAGSSA